MKDDSDTLEKTKGTKNPAKRTATGGSGNKNSNSSDLQTEVQHRKPKKTQPRSAEEKFRSLLEAAPDAMVIVNQHGNIELLNQQAENLLGYTSQELIGQAVEILLAPEVRETYLEHRKDYIKDPHRPAMDVGLEIHVLHKEGFTIPVEVNLSPLITEEGVMVTGVIRDNSGQKRAQRLLQASQLMLQQKNNSLAAINSIADRVYGSLDIQTVAREAVDSVMNHYTNSPCVAFFLWDEDAQCLVLRHSRGFDEAAVKVSERLPLKGSLSGVTVARKDVIISEDMAHDKRLEPNVKEQLLRLGFQSAISVPFLFQQKVLGVMNFLFKTLPGVDSEEHATLLAIGKTIGLAVANAMYVAKLETEKHEHQLAESALRESEQRFRKVVENAADAIFIHDEQGHLLDVNQQACQSLGYGREELLQLKVQDFASNFDAKTETQIWQQMDRDRPLTIEGVHQRKDGSSFPVEVRLGLMEQEGKPVMLALVRDITQRKHAEQAQQRAAKRLATLRKIDEAILMATSPAAIAQEALNHLAELIPTKRASVTLFDLDKREVLFLAFRGPGPQGEGNGKILPLDATFGSIEALQQGHVHRFDIEDMLQTEVVAKKLKQAGLRYGVNVPLIANDELIGALNLSGDQPPLAAGDEDIAGEVAGSLAIAIQQARLYEKIQRHASELERRVIDRTRELASANQELESFSYTVSHDLRSPLRSIDGFSHLLMDDYANKLDETAKEYLTRIRKASQRMGMLIDDLLALARVGRKRLEFSSVNLSEMALQISARLQDSEPARRCQWEVTPGLNARADPSLIHVVLDNLLSNAWKYTSKVARAHIEVGALDKNGQRVFYVSDNGAGFDMKYADQLFVPFQRLHQADEFEGTGIGLATVQRIIRRHGGEIWTESEPGKGAKFYFALNGVKHLNGVNQ